MILDIKYYEKLLYSLEELRDKKAFLAGAKEHSEPYSIIEARLKKDKILYCIDCLQSLPCEIASLYKSKRSFNHKREIKSLAQQPRQHQSERPPTKVVAPENPQNVIPVETGIQFFIIFVLNFWIPTCVGMTENWQSQLSIPTVKDGGFLR